MSKDMLLNLLIASGVLSLIGWAIKSVISGSLERWVDRVKKVEQDVIDESKKREAFARDVGVKFSEVEEQIAEICESKMDREEAMRENGRMRLQLESLLAGVNEIKGQLSVIGLERR